MGKLGSPFCIADLTGQHLRVNEELPEKHQWETLVNEGVSLSLVFPRKHYTEVQ